MFLNPFVATRKDKSSTRSSANTPSISLISTTKQTHRPKSLSATTGASNSNHNISKILSIWESNLSRISALHLDHHLHKVIQITPSLPFKRLDKSLAQRYREPVVVHHWRLHVNDLHQDQHLRSRSIARIRNKKSAHA